MEGVPLTFPDKTSEVKAAMPALRGRLLANQSLAELTWFRVGGPAQLLFTPADDDDLAYFLAQLPGEWPVHVIGVGSNLIVRDGGVPGVVIRLSPRGFGDTDVAARSSAPAPPRSTSASPRPRLWPVSADWNSCSAFPAPLAARCA